MARKTLAEMLTLISANNKSSDFSNELVLAVCWKESSFEESAKGVGSTALGLMQITKPAVDLVNDNTPEGVHFEHASMTDAASNLLCGTYYLQVLMKVHKNKKSALEHFGTGAGYGDNLLACETCLKAARKDADKTACLGAIHTFTGV